MTISSCLHADTAEAFACSSLITSVSYAISTTDLILKVTPDISTFTPLSPLPSLVSSGGIQASHCWPQASDSKFSLFPTASFGVYVAHIVPSHIPKEESAVVLSDS